MKKFLLLVNLFVISFSAFLFKILRPQPTPLFFLILLFCSNADLRAQAFSENFNNITTLPERGWVMQNASDPVGTSNWFQGNSGIFSAYNGVAEAYIAANYLNVLDRGTISNWLLSPVRTINNGDILTFYTRKNDPDDFSDRLEIRLSTSGTSTNVGSGSAVGDFSTLLLSINPALVQNVYPTSWTLYTVTVSGLSAPVSGRFAFRYFVTDAGNSGNNSDFIGIDQVRYTPVITPTAGIVYVKEGAIGNGSSWANAAGRLADAMVAAKTNTDITQIWVAAGVYKPLYSPADDKFGEDDARNNAFLLVNNVKVYGSFEGTETLLTDRNLSVTANASILSGDLGTENDNTDNAYHVVISAGPASTAELNGFTIKDGNADDNASSIVVNSTSVNQNSGAGMNITQSSPTLTHITISGNTAGYGGGGIYNISSSPILTDVTISGNTAGYGGGGIYNNANNFPTLTNVSITGNTAVQHGGGIVNISSSPTLTNVGITGNTAGANGGGIYNDISSSPTLTNVTISGNTAITNGGAMYNNSSAPMVRNSIIYGNNTGIVNNSSTPVLTYSLVQELPADATNLDGATNPLFVNAPSFSTAPFTTGDYNLQANSPVINKGNNAYFDASQTPDLSAITTDLAGNPRLYGTTIDMGAYELQQDALPVTLISFTASLQGENKVLLQWRTTSELNNKGFEIETLRSDKTYQKIGFVQGNGTTNTEQRYQTVVSDLPTGMHYFRLKMIDQDDTFAYSRLRSVQVTNGLELTTKLYPNPVTGQFVYIEMPNGDAKKANVKITNILGQVISSAHHTNFTGPLKIEMPAATGAYFIEVTADDALPVVKKVIKI